MKKVIITLVIVVLVLGIGTGGVLFWGYSNAKTDKTYAQKANSQVADFEKKYSDDYFEKQLKVDISNPSEEELKTAKAAIEQAKKDAESSLATLKSTKSSKRVTGIQKDAEDYFNLTIKAANNSLAYFEYSEILISVGESLEATGGEATSLVEVIAQFESAKSKIDEAIAELKKATPPPGMEQYNKDLIAGLESLSESFGKINAALKSGDLTALETYSNEVLNSMAKITGIDTPSAEEIEKNILTTDETKKLNELPAKISGEADSIAKKTIVF